MNSQIIIKSAFETVLSGKSVVLSYETEEEARTFRRQVLRMRKKFMESGWENVDSLTTIVEKSSTTDKWILRIETRLTYQALAKQLAQAIGN